MIVHYRLTIDDRNTLRLYNLNRGTYECSYSHRNEFCGTSHAFPQKKDEEVLDEWSQEE